MSKYHTGDQFIITIDAWEADESDSADKEYRITDSSCCVSEKDLDHWNRYFDASELTTKSFYEGDRKSVV